MSGRVKYRLIVDLWYETDMRMIRRIQAGENPPLQQRSLKHALAGDVVDDLPARSIPGLLMRGKIVPVAYATGDVGIAEDQPVLAGGADGDS